VVGALQNIDPELIIVILAEYFKGTDKWKSDV